MHQHLIAASLLLALGCSHPSAPSPHGGAESPGRKPIVSQDENSGATDGSGAPAPKAAAGSCTSDSDCIARASYCETSPCTCEIAAKRDPAPDCGGGTVNCFADPCMNRKAVCDEGHCALADSK